MRSSSDDTGDFFVGLLVAIGFSILLLTVAILLYRS
jgi:hypothetical protein